MRNKSNLFIFLLLILGGSFFVNSSVLANQSQVAKLTPILMLLLQEDEQTIELKDASRFLTQATFGPTYKEISSLSSSSYSRWIDRQISMPATTHYGFARDQDWLFDNGQIISDARRSSWLLASVYAQDQLRQRMAFALSQIFVLSVKMDGQEGGGTIFVDYYDELIANAFGNYRDLLEVVTLNSLMGAYLNMAQNSRAIPELGFRRPDENYAREVMQLFSIGVWELNLDGSRKTDTNGNPIPTYDESTIEQFSRVFTGWHYGDAIGFTHVRLAGPKPMVPYQFYHDTTSKELLKNSGAPYLLSAGQSARKDIEDALDNIFQHPNVAPFISKQLIQRFVTSNPTPAYVERVANVFNGNLPNGESAPHVRGDLSAVIRAILLDDEARNGHIAMPETFGKYKEPLLRLTAMWRAMNLQKQTLFSGVFIIRSINYLKQFPLEANTVFNFYRPDFSPPGTLAENELLAPEAQLMNLETVVSMATTFYSLMQPNVGTDIDGTNTAVIDTTHLQRLIPENRLRPEELVERLNLLLLAGEMPDYMREVLLNLHNQGDYPEFDKKQIVADIAYLMTLSPLFYVQR